MERPWAQSLNPESQTLSPRMCFRYLVPPRGAEVEEEAIQRAIEDHAPEAGETKY